MTDPNTSTPAQPPSLAVVACSVLEEEVAHFCKDLDHIRHLEYLETSLHLRPAKLKDCLQERIDTLSAEAPSYDAILLVYGLCGNGTNGLQARSVPVIVPRVHDCITFYLGSRQRYEASQRENPHRYWYTPGWNKSRQVPGPDRATYLREIYADQYDEEMIDELIEMDREQYAQYDTAVYTDVGAGDRDKEMDYTRRCAECMGWGFETVPGDPSFFKALFEGPWDDDRFLHVPPGKTITATNHSDILDTR